MKVDDTQLLKALKREQKKPYKDISDEEKIEAYPPKVEDLSREAGAMRGANEIHEWLTGKVKNE